MLVFSVVKEMLYDRDRVIQWLQGFSEALKTLQRVCQQTATYIITRKVPGVRGSKICVPSLSQRKKKNNKKDVDVISELFVEHMIENS